jgi:hypothetical protein
MIFGVILMIITILLTLYIVFSAAKCQKSFMNNNSSSNGIDHKSFTKCLSKITIIVSVIWWASLLLTKLMISHLETFDPVWKIEGTMFIVLAILLILGILLYRNHIYKKYFNDNIVNIILIEYTLSFIIGIMYAYILTYAFQSILIIL